MKKTRRSLPQRGFRIYDIADKSKPKLIHHQLTGGVGVHRFDMDARYAYISTGDGSFMGNILVTYDMKIRQSPRKCRAGGCRGRILPPAKHDLGRASVTACITPCVSAARCGRAAGMAASASSIFQTSPSRKTVASYNYHPPFPEPTHTVMPVPVENAGRRIGSVSMKKTTRRTPTRNRRAAAGRTPAWRPSTSRSGERQAAGAVRGQRVGFTVCAQARARFGAHQFHERMTGTLVHAVWFSGGLRIVDIADPSSPREVGHFIPEPCGGKTSPQSNDVVLDDRGLIYVVDRLVGFDVWSSIINKKINEI